MAGFLEQWADAVPDSMKTDFSQLHGVALTNDTGVEGGEKEVVYFPVSLVCMAPVSLHRKLIGWPTTTT